MEVSRRNLDTVAPTFKLLLAQPTTRVYVRIVGAGLQLTHLHLMSQALLHHEQQSRVVMHAVFYLSALWMLLINLINWGWIRDPICRAYSGYLGSLVLVLVLLCFDGYLAAFVLPESPMLVRGRCGARGRAALVVGDHSGGSQHGHQHRRWLLTA